MLSTRSRRPFFSLLASDVNRVIRHASAAPPVSPSRSLSLSLRRYPLALLRILVVVAAHELGEARFGCGRASDSRDSSIRQCDADDGVDDDYDRDGVSGFQACVLAALSRLSTCRVAR